MVRIAYANIGPVEGALAQGVVALAGGLLAFPENGDPAMLVDPADANKTEEGERTLIRYDPQNQLCRVVTADQVAKLVEALGRGCLLVTVKFEEQGRDACNNDTFCEMEDARKFVESAPLNQPGA
jgi:hypothetical protein